MSALPALCLCWGLAGPPWSPLADLQWFPPPAVSRGMLRLAEEHYNWLQSRRPRPGVPGLENWDAWSAEAALLHGGWGSLACAQDLRYSPEMREKYLKRLADDLGAEDFYRGRMPPPVPIWRFKRR